MKNNGFILVMDHKDVAHPIATGRIEKAPKERLDQLFAVQASGGAVDLRECTIPIRNEWRDEATNAHNLATLAALDDLDHDHIHAVPVDNDEARECEREGRDWYDTAFNRISKQVATSAQYINHELHFVRLDGTGRNVAKFVNEYRDRIYGLYPIEEVNA